MLLEVNHRERLHMVTNEVKRRLDYQVALQDLHRRMEQEHMVNWVEKSVVGSITPQQVGGSTAETIEEFFSYLYLDSDMPASSVHVFQEKESIAKCITDLKALAKSSKAQATV